MKKITIILPVYNEFDNISPLLLRLSKITRKLKKYSFEYLFIDDGSTDDSYNCLVKYKKKYPIKIVSFARNFGHQVALSAGIDYAKGDAAIIMDCDLQDPPELIGEMIKQWEKGYEVVYAKRRSRKDTLFKRTTAFYFYRILNKLSSVNIPSDTGDFRLIDKKVIIELRRFAERSRYIRGLVSYVGFKQRYVLFDREKRFAGETKYPLLKMINFALDAIFGFSTIPLKLITTFGFFIAIMSFLGILYAIFMKFFYPELTVSGWTLMMITIFFMGGVQMIVLGVIGEYVGRIYSETKKRPLYILRRKLLG